MSRANRKPHQKPRPAAALRPATDHRLNARLDAAAACGQAASDAFAAIVPRRSDVTIAAATLAAAARATHIRAGCSNHAIYDAAKSFMAVVSSEMEAVRESAEALDPGPLCVAVDGWQDGAAAVVDAYGPAFDLATAGNLADTESLLGRIADLETQLREARSRRVAVPVQTPPRWMVDVLRPFPDGHIPADLAETVITTVMRRSFAMVRDFLAGRAVLAEPVEAPPAEPVEAPAATEETPAS